jgi:hypothetical protein
MKHIVLHHLFRNSTYLRTYGGEEVNMKSTVLVGMTLYSLVEIYCKFEEDTSALFRNVLEIDIIPPKYQ